MDLLIIGCISTVLALSLSDTAEMADQKLSPTKLSLSG